MLLSRDAIASASEICKADDFYKPAHGHVFEAILSLYGHGEPVDPVTVADELRRASLLEAVGGPAILISLQASTPATSSAARYAEIVSDHSVLRRLIGAAGEIAELGYDVPDDVQAAVDRAESMIFEIGQHRVADTLRQIRDLLDESLDRLQALYDRGESITGVPTGYHDLDEQLSGLQPSSLVVVGARPSAGKTAFALGMAAHAAVEARIPVLFFSLEMSHLEITQRLLCADARVDATRMRNGRLQDADWSKISHAIGRLGDAPIFIDDNPNLTIMDIRAKARRLKSREDLGLVIVDYLQLMSGRTSAENRQVEVSEISRGLKILARELHVPVVALSQLSRNLENRSDKRPILADLRESGCMTADTRVLRADTGAEVSMGELLLTGERNIPVWTLDEDLKMSRGVMTHVFPSGIKRVYELRLASGHRVKASANHPFLTIDGWRRLDELAPGSRIATPRRLPEPAGTSRWPEAEVVMLAHLLGGGCFAPGQPVHYESADEENLRAVECSAGHFGITSRRVSEMGRTQLHLAVVDRGGHGGRHPIQEWLGTLGLAGLRGDQKFIPRPVFSLPGDQVRLFLRHLWATDAGTRIDPQRRRVRLCYSTSSRRLADDLQRLLLRVDITSRLRPVASRQGTWYRLDIRGAALQSAFLRGVSVHGPGSTGPGAAALLDTVGAGRPDPDTFPREIWARVRSCLDRSGTPQRVLAPRLVGGLRSGGSAFAPEPTRVQLAELAEALADDGLERLARSDVSWDRVVGIEELGDEPVYDATVEGTHNFIANGIVAENSIEQDSDVVMFIYRDEIYNPESADRGTAEIIVSKHRNGPTGVARLAFLEHYARFANMARV